MPDSVRASCWPSDSSCGDADRSKFICFVYGREPKVNEVWILDEDGVTPEVHHTAQVDVDARFLCKFATIYLTENGFKTSIFCENSINRSFEFFSVPDPLKTNGPYLIDNILVTILAWGFGGTVTNLNWGI